MSRNGHLLPIPAGGPLDELLSVYVAEWERGTAQWPYRSDWLSDVEEVLRGYYPDASRADLNLTARHLAPFPLLEGHNVP